MANRLNWQAASKREDEVRDKALTGFLLCIGFNRQAARRGSAIRTIECQKTILIFGACLGRL
ncbi:hypothetical protein KU74_06175 [Pectobacterium brasiliense]|uniref:Uncharacterized protein n=1 Tax=Pectobacterium brasiliense TaxID=180957 RepID=A0A0M2F6Z3_9GAMM|nr:hypothetical protein KU74_06175 [Pectobacterium brasiliense]